MRSASRHALACTIGFATLAAAAPAHAGARPHAFVQGTDALPEGGLEWENWFGVASPGAGAADWEWWTGAVDGITPSVEAGVFAIMNQPEVTTSSGAAGMSLDAVRLQLTWQPVERGQWPVDLRLRGELGVPVAGERVTSLWLEALASRDAGRLKLIANAGDFVEVARTGGGGSKGDNYYVGGLGASLDATHGLRVGGEAYAEGSFGDAHDHAWIAGPSVAWGRGRIWISGTWAVGLDRDSPDRRARLVLGVVL